LPDEPESPVLEIANRHFAAGRYADAAALYAQVPDQNPGHVRAQVYLGIIHRQDGKLSSAEQHFAHALDADPDGPFASLALHSLGGIRQRCGDDKRAIELFQRSMALKPDSAPTFNDLGVSLQRLGRNKAALAAFERAILLDPFYVTALRNCGLILSRLGRIDGAAEKLLRATALNPNDPEILTHFGLTQLKLENFEKAVELFRRAIALDPASIDLHVHLAEALDGCHRLEEAEQEFDEWIERKGVVVATPCTTGQPKARILLLAGSYLCNTPTKFLFSEDRFETATIYFSNRITQAKQLSDFDLVFNAISDADRGMPFLKQAVEFCSGLDCPVLNPPERIASTRRDRIASALSDIPHLEIPSTQRMNRAALMASLPAADFFVQPLLIRPVGSHGGRDLKKVHHPAELSTYVKAMPFDDYYVSAFHDYRSADGYYRKYRFIFVDRAVYPLHLAVSDEWLVHYWRADMNRADWKEEEEAFLVDYRAVFSGALVHAIQAVANRLDLDFAGLDCAITTDGRVLIFEANATMLVQLDDSSESFPYKQKYVPRIFEAIDRLVGTRLRR
jgi:tetratricopeptide (TPR) repeat protein